MIVKPPPPAFWVMTANICGNEWLGWNERALVCADVISHCPCGVIGFQEFGAHSLAAIAPLRPDLEFILGERMDDIFVNTVAFDRERFTPLDAGTLWLAPEGCSGPGWDAAEPRAASWVRLRDTVSGVSGVSGESGATGSELLVVNTHLDHKGRVSRERGMRMLLDFVDAAHGSTPTVITADINVSIDSADPRWRRPAWRRPYDLAIERGFVDAWRACRAGQVRRPVTYHAFQGSDYAGDEEGTHDPDVIFLRGFECATSVLVRDSRSGIYPSDHYFQMALCRDADA